ncbi:kinase-like domain-containing protein [Rhizophagus irregularis DAOM 181602=DAOM 197198]|nr:kinase-like domain-containing protein [Rhizophagus irregularis DAOM 181602=DAOM 197198]
MFSQNIPLSKDNILEYLETNFTNWTSGNEKINSFIQEMQLKISHYDDNDMVLEWIPYNQFNEIKETGKHGLITVYSAIWRDGPLYKKYNHSGYIRDSNKKVALKCLYNSQESIDSLINEAKKYPTKYKAFQESIDSLINEAKKYSSKYQTFQVLYGISQNPDTGDYILVQNKSIDSLINEAKKYLTEYKAFQLLYGISQNPDTGDYILVQNYAANWINYTRDSNNKVALKCFHNSQEFIDSLKIETEQYPTNYEAFQVLHGISQNPVTGDYILVQNNFISLVNWIRSIDTLINEAKKYSINTNNKVFFSEDYTRDSNKKVALKCLHNTQESIDLLINEAKKHLTKYKKSQNSLNNYTRDSNKDVALKCLHNSQESIDFLINKAGKYLTKYRESQVLYGISQNPDTEDYILEIGKGGFSTVYSAIWKDAPLDKKVHNRNGVIALKCLHSSQNITDKFLNEVKEYSINKSTTGRQPFGNRAHDYDLALDICKGIGPEISEPEVPRCYIDLMKKCWDLDKNNRPDVFGLDKEITSFLVSYTMDLAILGEIKIQFEEAEEYRKANISSTENYQIVTHPQAIYTSRLLNPITKDLPKNDDGYNSQCLDDCALPISFK